MNPNVDVFVNFYAPCTLSIPLLVLTRLTFFVGCPYSHRLNPTWVELGKRLESQRDKIVIAQMDGTQNEVPGMGLLLAILEYILTLICLRASHSRVPHRDLIPSWV